MLKDTHQPYRLVIALVSKIRSEKTPCAIARGRFDLRHAFNLAQGSGRVRRLKWLRDLKRLRRTKNVARLAEHLHCDGLSGSIFRHKRRRKVWRETRESTKK